MSYNEFIKVMSDVTLQKNMFECITLLIVYGIIQTSLVLFISTKLLEKRKKKKSVIPFVLLMLGILFTLFLDYVFFFRNNEVMDMVMRWFWIFFSICIIHIYYEGSILKSILTFIISVTIHTIVSYGLHYLNLLITTDTFYAWWGISRTIEQFIWSILCYIVVFFCEFLLLKANKKLVTYYKNKDIENQRIYIFLGMAFLYSPAIMIAIIETLSVRVEIEDWIKLLIFLFLEIGALEYVYYKELAKKTATTNNIYENQVSFYKALEQNIEKTNQLKRDIEGNVSILQALQEGGLETQEFEKELLKKYAETNKITYTNNTIIDSLLHQYMEKYKSSPIEITVRISLPPNMQKRELDVNTLLSQLFEFALEQCKLKQTTDKTHIHLDGYMVKNYLFFVMECTKTDMLEHGKYRLFHRGMSHIHMNKIKVMKDICHRNDGSINMEEMADTVKITAMLQVTD